MLIGTAGLAAFVGTDPVIAQHRIQGLFLRSDIEKYRFIVTLKVNIKIIIITITHCD